MARFWAVTVMTAFGRRGGRVDVGGLALRPALERRAAAVGASSAGGRCRVGSLERPKGRSASLAPHRVGGLRPLFPSLVRLVLLPCGLGQRSVSHRQPPLPGRRAPGGG